MLRILRKKSSLLFLYFEMLNGARKLKTMDVFTVKQEDVYVVLWYALI